MNVDVFNQKFFSLWSPQGRRIFVCLGKVYIVKAKAMSFPIRNCKSIVYKDNHQQETRGLHMFNLARCGSHKPTLWSYIFIFVYPHCHYYTFKCQLFPWCLAICVSAEVIELSMCHERVWGKCLHCFPFNAVQTRLFSLCAQDVWWIILKQL